MVDTRNMLHPIPEIGNNRAVRLAQAVGNNEEGENNSHIISRTWLTGFSRAAVINCDALCEKQPYSPLE